jgi:hypothetical protein
LVEIAMIMVKAVKLARKKGPVKSSSVGVAKERWRTQKWLPLRALGQTGSLAYPDRVAGLLYEDLEWLLGKPVFSMGIGQRENVGSAVSNRYKVVFI